MRTSSVAVAVLAGLVISCSREDRKAAPTTSTTVASTTETKSSATSAAPSAASPQVVVLPDVETIPWETGDAIGAGVARKDTGNVAGDNVLVAWAGWRVSLESAEAWATALYHASFEQRGVRFIFAVQGPKDPLYRSREIGTEALAVALVSTISAKTKFVAAVAHSSGAYVANDLFARLAHGGDPLDTTRGRIAYFNLDGGEAGLDASIVERLRRAYFVGAYDAKVATASHEDDDMRAAGATYANAGGYLRHVADGSGCNRGATWCLHMTLVTSKPHDPGKAKEIDFSDFAGREVAHAFIDEKASEAGLTR